MLRGGQSEVQSGRCRRADSIGVYADDLPYEPENNPPQDRAGSFRDLLETGEIFKIILLW